MTQTPPTETDGAEPTAVPLSRRTVLKGSAVAFGLAGAGTGAIGALSRPVAAQGIETCGATLDVVLAIDYSGSIRSAGTWNDILQGATDFVNELAPDNRIGLVTFGDTAKAYDFGDRDYLVFAEEGGTDNRPTVVDAIPDAAPPQENGTHMAAGLDLANAVLDEQGRGEKEVIVLLTDGEPNYENGEVGDGSDPPADEGTDTVGGVVGWDPSEAQAFDPDKDGTRDTFTYTGGKTGGEDAVITDGERNETAAVAAAARGDTEYTLMDGTTASVTPSDPTRIVTVGIGNADADYLSTKIATSPEDHVQTTAENIGTALVGLLEELCEAECVVDLLAGQYTDVGSVSLVQDGDTLAVTYTTDDDWYLTELHLHVAESVCDVPTTGNGKFNPKVGHFDYPAYPEAGTQEYTVEVDVGDLEAPMIVAAHAVVVHATEMDGDVVVDARETAWGDGCGFNTDGGNWGTFVVFDPESDVCGCPTDFALPDCDGDTAATGGRGRARGRGKGR